MRSSLAFCMVLCFLVMGVSGFAQDQTVGLFFNTSHSENGYTLFTRHNTVYLIDNCGYIVHTWESDDQKGGVVYLLDNGDLLRASSIPAAVDGVPGGGLIVKYSWEGEILWNYKYAYPLTQQHHDIQPMPNGNVLMLAWNLKTVEEAVAAGRDPDVVSSYGILYESVIEIEPVGTDSGKVVWEWHMWDHLVQGMDSTKSNYGAPKEHPELIDINFNDYSGSFSHDWVHANAVHYNSIYDEVVISAKNFSELWVIDHSTTTEEAAGHSGGRHGKGGDVVYRWGNPQTYGRGTANDRVLYGQHDVHYVAEGLGYDNGIMMFNNGDRRPGEHFSEVIIIHPPRDMDGRFVVSVDSAFGPETPEYIYAGMGNDRLSSRWLSSAHMLPNGNVFICEGNAGRFTEVDKHENVVWKYISPLDSDGIVEQGQEVNSHRIFRATRHPESHPAFMGKNLPPIRRIEINPIEDECEIFIESTIGEPNLLEVRLLGNVVRDELVVDNPLGLRLRFDILTIEGKALDTHVENGRMISLPAGYPAGLYFLSVSTGSDGFTTRFFISG